MARKRNAAGEIGSGHGGARGGRAGGRRRGGGPFDRLRTGFGGARPCVSYCPVTRVVQRRRRRPGRCSEPLVRSPPKPREPGTGGCAPSSPSQQPHGGLPGESEYGQERAQVPRRRTGTALVRFRPAERGLLALGRGLFQRDRPGCDRARTGLPRIEPLGHPGLPPVGQRPCAACVVPAGRGFHRRPGLAGHPGRRAGRPAEPDSRTGRHSRRPARARLSPGHPHRPLPGPADSRGGRRLDDPAHRGPRPGPSRRTGSGRGRHRRHRQRAAASSGCAPHAQPRLRLRAAHRSTGRRIPLRRRQRPALSEPHPPPHGAALCVSSSTPL
ncbi:hypothetical protein SALBM135S_02468 [Streptomyces alboniger]